MKLLKLSTFLLLMLALLNSCRKNEEIDSAYRGEYSITLIPQGDTSGIEGEGKDLVYQVVLSKSSNQNLKLDFSLEGNGFMTNDLLKIENPVIIHKNETKGTLTIKINQKLDANKILMEDKTFQIKLKNVEGTDDHYTLAKDYSIKVLKDEDFTPLTDTQRALLEYYKSQGLDLYQWIGKIPVEVTVNADHNGSMAPFDQAFNKVYTGFSYITLSDKATRDKPILKMVKNAMGLSSYLEYVMMNETILNEEYWLQTPASQKILAFLGNDKVTKWKNKEYAFDITLDNLIFNKNGTIQFVYPNGANSIYTNFLKEDRTNKISAVDFQYHFPLWDELKKIAKNNIELSEAIIQGGSIHPNNYMPNSPILTDDWEDGSWVAPTASFDNDVMNFKFNFDHVSSGGYDVITVKYTVPSKK